MSTDCLLSSQPRSQGFHMRTSPRPHMKALGTRLLSSPSFFPQRQSCLQANHNAKQLILIRYKHSQRAARSFVRGLEIRLKGAALQLFFFFAQTLAFSFLKILAIIINF